MKNLFPLLGLVCAGWLVSCQPAECQTVPFHNKSEIVFADTTQAKKALSRLDVFVKSLSQFDRQSRMQVDGKPTTEEYLAFVNKHVVAWNKDQKEKLTVAIGSIAEKLKGYEIPFPAKILLITTDGKEEGGAAYCRGPAIVLPQNMVGHMKVKPLEQLLTHELFHVLSNQNPELRQKLYAIVGFHPCGEIKLPPALVDRKLTNPDGPTLDYYVDVEVEGKKVSVVPLLFAKSRYDAKKGGSFFQYMQFELMAIEKSGEQWKPTMKGDLPVFYPPQQTESYFDSIGRNTGYIIHPDEVLADNFKYMVHGRKNLKTPRIVDEMKSLLQKQP